jgi:hypothetical protein
MSDNFDPKKLRLSPEQVAQITAAEAIPQRRIELERVRKRREHFVKIPQTWVERLQGASGRTYHVALELLYGHWKGKGKPVKLANGALAEAGVSPDTKLRALPSLEQRGLVAVDWRLRRSPLVTVHTEPSAKLRM